jgi:DNA-binding CsgD family transcriptional regulator
MIALAALNPTPSAGRTQSQDSLGVEAPDGSLLAALMEACNWLQHGILLVDAARRIHFANAKAQQQLLSRYLFVKRGRLAASSDIAIALNRLIAGCARANGHEEESSILCHAGLLLQVAPLTSLPTFLGSGGRMVAIYLIDPAGLPDPDPVHLRLQFRLTATEATLACEIVKGNGLPHCAARMGISITTARTHLCHVFAKVGVRRQAELVRRLLGSRPIARRS